MKSPAPQQPWRNLGIGMLGWIAVGAALTAIAGTVFQQVSLAADISPIAFFAAGVVLLVAIVSKAGRANIGIASTAVALFALILAPETAALAAQRLSMSPSDQVLKVLTANVWSSNPNHTVFLDYVRAERPDVVVVVEAYRGWRGSLQQLAPEYQLVAGCAAPHECDVIVLSRLAHAADQPRPLASRVIARLVLPERLGGQTFDVMGLHLNRPKPGAGSRPDLDEAAAIASRFGVLGIAAGDFNATPWSAALRRFDDKVSLIRQTRWMPTWPTRHTLIENAFKLPLALAPIDHVYAGKAWRPVRVERGPDIGSDHFPVLVELARTRL